MWGVFIALTVHLKVIYFLISVVVWNNRIRTLMKFISSITMYCLLASNVCEVFWGGGGIFPPALSILPQPHTFFLPQVLSPSPHILAPPPPTPTSLVFDPPPLPLLLCSSQPISLVIPPPLPPSGGGSKIFQFLPLVANRREIQFEVPSMLKLFRKLDANDDIWINEAGVCDWGGPWWVGVLRHSSGGGRGAREGRGGGQAWDCSMYPLSETK